MRLRSLMALALTVSLLGTGCQFPRDPEEAGHVLAGEIWVVPSGGDVTTEQTEELTKRLFGLDWRIHDVVVVPVAGVDGAPEATRIR